MHDYGHPIPDYLLEQYALGELSGEEARRLDRCVEQDPDLRARLAALRVSNEGILAEHPPAEFARAVELRARGAAAVLRASGSRRSAVPRWMIFAPAAAAVALLTLVVVKQGPVLRRESDLARTGAQTEVTREKGRPQLRIYRRAGTGIDSLRETDAAARGDVLQLSYAPFGRLHGVILSIDGRGTVTLHFPAAPDQSTRLVGRGETLLPDAYELDDAPGFERFFLVTSSAPIDVPAVLSAARNLAGSVTAARHDSLPLPSSLEQTSFLIRKRGASI
jgi:hypothetical protein